MDGIEKTIRESLKRIHQFTTPEGLFKTYRIDYSEKDCPNDYINESKATFIDTKYDHAFILDILFRLKEYFPSEEKFLNLLQKGIKLIMDDAVITEQTINGKKVKTLQWRHYNIPHKNREMILPDIDNTARNLIVLEKAKDFFKFVENHELLQEYNFEQFVSLLTPLDMFLKPSSQNSDYLGFFTYFGDKKENDVDPFCTMSALYSMIFSDNLNYLKHVRKVFDYINACINSSEINLQYYTLPMVIYNYSKLLEICTERDNKDFISHGLREKLISYVIENKQLANNPLDSAFLVNSLIILGHRGPEIEKGVRYIIKRKKAGNSWDAYKFYKQRHPYRIFGSRGLTTAVCLESLWLWNKISK